MEASQPGLMARRCSERLFAAVRESGFGPKRTRRRLTVAAAIGGKADITI